MIRRLTSTMISAEDEGRRRRNWYDSWCGLHRQCHQDDGAVRGGHSGPAASTTTAGNEILPSSQRPMLGVVLAVAAVFLVSSLRRRYWNNSGHGGCSSAWRRTAAKVPQVAGAAAAPTAPTISTPPSSRRRGRQPRQRHHQRSSPAAFGLASARATDPRDDERREEEEDDDGWVFPTRPGTVVPGCRGLLDSTLDGSLSPSSPAATDEERARFRIAFEGKHGGAAAAEESLSRYLEWRGRYSDVEAELTLQPKDSRRSAVSPSLSSSPSSSSDADDWTDWNTAASVAVLAVRRDHQDSADAKHARTRSAFRSDGNACLPRIVRTFERTPVVENGTERPLESSRRRHRILQVLPAMIDERLVPCHNLTTYSLAIALYLDRKLDRTSREKMIVVVDVRGGYGWRNLPALKLISFMKQTSKLLTNNFPERLQQFFVYPVPYALLWIWKVVKRFLDPATATKFCVLSGCADIDSDPPEAELMKLIAEIEDDVVGDDDDDTRTLLARIEASRKADFVFT